MTATTVLDFEIVGEPRLNPDQIRLQWLGGFYPSGAIIALECHWAPTRDRLGELRFNPADPDVARLLRRYSKSREIELPAGDGADPLALHHGGQARQELQVLLEKAERHLAGLRRLDWDETVAEFTAGGMW